MADSFTVTESTGLFGRLGGSLKAMVAGLLLFVISFPLLWWNEGRAVDRYKTLKEGAGMVVSTASDSVDPDLEGGLVHTTGKAQTDDILRDPVFGVSENAIHLHRKTEMYQWDEDSRTEVKKKLGGGEDRVTTYAYEKVWSSRAIDSGNFHEPGGHGNPGRIPYPSESYSAEDVRVGAYRLSGSLVGSITDSEPVPLPDDALQALPAEIKDRSTRVGTSLYIGEPNVPTIGDMRVSFARVPAAVVSILAKQQGDLLTTYTLKRGTIERLQLGEHTADAMFQQAEAENKVLTWIVRAVGFFMMMIGLKILMEPLAVLGDIVPFIGTVVRAGGGLIAAILALALSAITIGIAWIAYRPLLGGSLLAVAAGAIFWGRSVAKKRGPAAAPAAPSAPPPAAPPPPPPE